MGSGRAHVQDGRNAGHSFIAALEEAVQSGAKE
jgi:hypothetical protein